MDNIIYTINQIVKEYKTVKAIGAAVLYTAILPIHTLYNYIRHSIIHSCNNIPQKHKKLIEYHSDAIALDAIDKFDNFTTDNYQKESMKSKRHSARIDYWTPVRKDIL